MGWIAIILEGLKLVNRIWDAVKERNEEKKREKTQVIQNNARAIIDRDPSRIVSSFDDMRRVRGL